MTTSQINATVDSRRGEGGLSDDNTTRACSLLILHAAGYVDTRLCYAHTTQTQPREWPITEFLDT